MYTAAAGMAAQQQRLAALSNDLANVNTTGYKRVRVAFRDLVYTPAGPGTAPGIQEGAGAAAQSVGRGAAQGALKRTDRPLDVALDGPGLIRVINPSGERGQPRDAVMWIDAQRRLVTKQGYLPVVTVPNGTAEGDVHTAPSGTVTVGGRYVGSLDR